MLEKCGHSDLNEFKIKMNNDGETLYVPLKLFLNLGGLIYLRIETKENLLFPYTVAINDLLCMKNAGAQIAMDFS